MMPAGGGPYVRVKKSGCIICYIYIYTSMRVYIIKMYLLCLIEYDGNERYCM